ncbi:MAG: cbb3-type cytochrome c oxidase subunit II [Planctomycetota bacterium]
MNSPDVISSQETEQYRFDNRIVGLFTFASVVWGVIAMVASSATWWILLSPEAMAADYTYARLGGGHLYLLVYAFAANGVFAGMYFSIQRLCKCEMANRSLSWLHFAAWQFVLVWAIVTLAYGHTEHRSGLDFILAVDFGFAICMLLFLANLVMTLFRRRERHMYISLWYYLASAIAVVPLQLLPNMAEMGEGYESRSWFSGAADGMLQLWAPNAMLFYLVLVPLIGLFYHFVPKVTEVAVPNYRLAVLQFWATIAFGVFASSRFLQYTAGPEWLMSMAMLAGVGMFLPAWVGVTNGWTMLRGSRGKRTIISSPILQFLLAGLLFYAVVIVDIGLTSVLYFSSWNVFTDWSVAHVYAVSAGIAPLVFAGLAYWTIPQFCNRGLWNKELLRIQVAVSVAGAALLVLPLYINGWLQGSMAFSTDDIGTLNYPEHVEILQSLTSGWWAVMAGGFLAAVGLVMLGVNLGMTWLFRGKQEQVRTTIAPRLLPGYEDELPPKSALEGQAVLDLGIKIDRWKHMTFHRKWERSPGVFVTMISVALGFGFLCHMGAVWATMRSDQPAAVAYTPLELAGREIYVREGCASCHTQAVRPLRAETTRYGDYSVAADYAYDQPTQWGTRRIGPDLAREGGRQNAFWHWQHLSDPRALTEGSLMPSFAYLLEQPLEVEAVRQLLIRESNNGQFNSDAVIYSEELLAEDTLTIEDRMVGETTELEQALQQQAEMIAADMVMAGGPAARFHSEATALIAYLQRLGAPDK